MEKEFYEYKKIEVETLIRLGDRPDYWAGYLKGLRRRFHGDAFGTQKEHEKNMNLVGDSDKSRVHFGLGYHDAYVPDYCTQNNGDCVNCSLSSYGHDCRNNKI